MIRQGGRTKKSAIAKQTLSGGVRIDFLGLEGDEQADTKHHGGREQALCCYPLEHYSYWSQRLGWKLQPPAFGENFATEGVTEETACIGDVFRAGTALVQITQPRAPCATLALFLREDQLAAWAAANGLTGWYMKVLQPGTVRGGDSLLLEDRPGRGVTVMDVNRALWQRGSDVPLLERVLEEELLAVKWRAKLQTIAGRVLAACSLG